MIAYQEITPDDYETICTLYEAYLNSGDTIREQIYHSMHNPDFAGIKATVNGEIVGVSYGSAGVTLTFPHPDLERELAGQIGGRKVFCYDALILVDEYRAHHISTEMNLRLRKLLQKRGFEVAFCEIWVYPDGTMPALQPFLHFGQTFYTRRVAGFYRGLGKYGIRCPICGENCSCGAQLQLVEMGEEHEE